jgi:hypothetical protein
VEKFADTYSSIGRPSRLDDKWVSLFEGFKGKTKNFKIDELQESFGYYIDKITNTSKIDYTNS